MLTKKFFANILFCIFLTCVVSAQAATISRESLSKDQVNVQLNPVVEMRPSSNPPSIPAGMKCACMTDQQSTAFNPNCPVIVYKGKTFWAFSYIDNRMSLGIVSYDATGKVCTTVEKPGARYVYKITVDNTAKTVTFWGQANQTVTMTWAELSAECVQPDPVVEMRPSSNPPSIPAGMKCTCTVDAQSAPSPNCPVIVYKGKTFWAYSYIDNRMSLGIVSYDATGKVCTTVEKPGARYIYKITVDNAAKTVTFWGQANQSVTMSWAELSM